MTTDVTDRGSNYNKEDGLKNFQTVKLHFTIVMKVMIVIMTMRIIMKIMNSTSSEAVAQRCSVKKVFLEISQNSQENTCTKVSFLMKLPATLLKETLWRRCFPVNFAKFLRTPFLTEHLRWLLLPVILGFCQ